MINKLRENINQYFVGKKEVVEDVLTCLLAGGHVLIEDVPGVGKTTLARTVSSSINCSFGRIQFTPDTLPSDVIGLSVYNMKTGEFAYREGSIMHEVILADEINRTSPKTQSSLLEAMAEKQVTVDGVNYKLPELFMVIATQNPVEFLGTYPLPEAQLDRFMMKLSIGYPDSENEIIMAKHFLGGNTIDEVKSVCSVEDVLKMRLAVSDVKVSEKLLGYIEEIIDLTRKETSFIIGASPRAFLNMVRASQARAYLEGRDFVKPDEVKVIAINTLHHRIVLTPEAKIRKESIDKILTSLILRAKVPME